MSSTTKGSRFTANVIDCPDWRALTVAFDEIPAPVLRRDEEGETFRRGWVFCGHKRKFYPLQPSIERAYPYTFWPEAEYRLLREFQAKAPMHMDPATLPEPNGKHKLSWLAIMQHYGAPTRLLDFTYSPYVALYFALRNRNKDDAECVEVWALDFAQLIQHVQKIDGELARDIRKRSGKTNARKRIDFGDPDSYASALERAQEEDERGEEMVSCALNPTGVRRMHYDRNGMIRIALPPVQMYDFPENAPYSWTVLMAVSILPYAVTTMADGPTGYSWRRWRRNSIPSMPGMIRSVTMASKLNSCALRSASTPSAAVSVENPQRSIMRATADR
jgi:hypothetical protein